MAETTTRFTGASVARYLASRASPEQLADCKAIMAMCQRVTKQKPRMWGPSIVGFGSYRYTYESGHTGEAPLTGFAIRGRDIVIYMVTHGDRQKALLSKVGKYTMSKSCFYFRRLSDLDRSVLEQLVRNCVADLKRRYG